MQNAKAPSAAAAKGSLTATTALLCLLSAPVLAATGLDGICDDSAEYGDTHDLGDLNIETIDSPLTSRIASEHELAGGGGEDEMEILPTAKREQEILRRIFDEPVPKASDDAISSADAADEIETPRIEERSADIADTDPVDSDTSNPLLPGVRLPDAAPEDMHRYRRQMFRTDI